MARTGQSCRDGAAGDTERHSRMNALVLRGGSRAEAGAYREVRSGHVVYLGTEGYLPGQINSETYVKVPDRLYLHERLQRVLRERRGG